MLVHSALFSEQIVILYIMGYQSLRYVANVSKKRELRAYKKFKRQVRF